MVEDTVTWLRVSRLLHRLRSNRDRHTDKKRRGDYTPSPVTPSWCSAARAKPITKHQSQWCQIVKWMPKGSSSKSIPSGYVCSTTSDVTRHFRRPARTLPLPNRRHKLLSRSSCQRQPTRSSRQQDWHKQKHTHTQACARKAKPIRLEHHSSSQPIWRISTWTISLFHGLNQNEQL